MTIKSSLKAYKKKNGLKPRAGNKQPAVRRSKSYRENGVTYSTSGVRVKVIAD
jgi:hypothetical protein